MTWLPALADCNAAPPVGGGVGGGGGGNGAPTAVITGPTTGSVNFNVTFDGLASTDPELDPLTYRWDMGDGTLLTGATVTHFYTAANTYTVTLVVNDGQQDSLPAIASIVISFGGGGGGMHGAAPTPVVP